MTDRVNGYDNGYRGIIDESPELRSKEYLIGYAHGIRDAANNAAIRAERESLGTKKIVIDQTFGKHKHNIDPGSHTLLFDLNRMSEAAIGDFIKEIIKQWPVKKQFTASDFIGLAIGRFEVPLADIFDGTVEELSALDDATLAQIFRFREAKAKE